MITAIVIDADLAKPIRQQQIDNQDAGAYNTLVGGHLELVTLERPSAAMYIDEEGKLKHLPVNERATALASVHNSAIRGRDIIVGPAVLVGDCDQDGDDTSVPGDLVDLLFNTKRYRVQVRADSHPRWVGNELDYLDWFQAYRAAVGLALRWTAVDDVRVVPDLTDEVRECWYQIGKDNPWIRNAVDPPFTPSSFVGCYSIEELQEQLSYTNWSLGSAFYYRDLCFINQVNGGDEWLTIRHGIAFESITFQPSIERGDFTDRIHRLLAATKQQCQRLEY